MPAFLTLELMASYAIISVGGKQYRVREGERLLVDRLATEAGKTFSPAVLLVGGEDEPRLAPKDAVVTARVVSQERGPKIRIGKYRKRTGYRRHTGFRAALTRIEIEAIGSGKAQAAAKPQAATAEKAEASESALPAGYAEMTVADVKGAAAGWSTEQSSAQRSSTSVRTRGRKGALAALEAALTDTEEG